MSNSRLCGVVGLLLAFCTQGCGFDPSSSRCIFMMQKIDRDHIVRLYGMLKFRRVSVWLRCSSNLHAGPLTTHFDGEVEAIHIALQQLAVRLPPIERAVILSDSTSALQALSNYNENNCLRVQNCRELLGKIKGNIIFQWVPSHYGLWGNERADFWAKKGTGILQNFRRDLTLHSAKLENKRIFRESFRLTASRVARDKPWSTLCKKSHSIPSSPRAAVAKFRPLTGHDCLCAHLFRFNLVTSPICVLCDTGQDMTAAHLDECSALNDLNCIVKRYWRARCLMT
ncbi:uncharacterized protein LOC103524116 [Trichonephila clavipes]|nr:uncharacterized protein LOC103524116 [Trichonephila clavipes]